MLQDFLRSEKWADKFDSNFREGTNAEIGICSRPVWVSAYGRKSSTPGNGGFLQWIFGRKVQKKNLQKIRWNYLQNYEAESQNKSERIHVTLNWR